MGNASSGTKVKTWLKNVSFTPVGAAGKCSALSLRCGDVAASRTKHCGAASPAKVTGKGGGIGGKRGRVGQGTFARPPALGTALLQRKSAAILRQFFPRPWEKWDASVAAQGACSKGHPHTKFCAALSHDASVASYTGGRPEHPCGPLRHPGAGKWRTSLPSCGQQLAALSLLRHVPACRHLPTNACLPAGACLQMPAFAMWLMWRMTLEVWAAGWQGMGSKPRRQHPPVTPDTVHARLCFMHMQS